MKIQHGWRIAVAALALLAGSGCAVFLVGAGVAIGAGTVAYVEGELRAGASVPFDQACRATLQAVTDLDLKVINTARDKLTMTVIARTADDRRVKILVRRQGDKETSFFIRVGTLGDETLSRAIYDKIKSHF